VTQERPIDKVRRAAGQLGTLKRSGKWWRAICPLCQRKWVLAFQERPDGKVNIRCWAQEHSLAEIAASLDLDVRDFYVQEARSWPSRADLYLAGLLQWVDEVNR
jgi:hypothetical protein